MKESVGSAAGLPQGLSHNFLLLHMPLGHLPPTSSSGPSGLSVTFITRRSLPTGQRKQESPTSAQSCPLPYSSVFTASGTALQFTHPVIIAHKLINHLMSISLSRSQNTFLPPSSIFKVQHKSLHLLDGVNE